DGQRIFRIKLLDAQGALDVDIEHDVAAGHGQTLDLRAKRPIKLIIVHFFPFRKGLEGDPHFERVDGQVIVVLAVRLMRALCARRCRYGEGGLRERREDMPDDRRLARSARGREDDELAGCPHTMLANCSLIFSNSFFIPTTRCWSGLHCALAPRVLISRPISWAMKLSCFDFWSMSP